MLLNQGDQIRHTTNVSDARMSTQAWRESREGTLKGNVAVFQSNLVFTCFTDEDNNFKTVCFCHRQAQIVLVFFMNVCERSQHR